MQRRAGRAPLVELRDGKVRDADRADLAGLQQVVAGARRLGDRLRRGPVQLEQIDPLDAEALKAGVAFGDHVGAVGARRLTDVSAPTPNLVKTSGRRDAGNDFSARPTIVSEWPPP